MIKKNYYKIMSIMLGVFLILPSTVNIFDISIFKISTVIVTAFLIYLYANKIIEKRDILNKFIFSNLIITLIIAISVIININNMQLNDIFEIIRFLVMAEFTVITIIICKKENQLKYLLKVLIIMLTIVSIFGIIQNFNPFNINKLYIKYYAPTQQTTLIDNYPNPRIIGTKTGPASMGTIMVIGIFFNIIYYKYVKEKKHDKYFCIASILLMFIALMMTLSRTTQIAFFVSLVCGIAILTLYKKGIKFSILFALLSILTLIIVILVLPRSLTWRILEVLNISEATSWIARIEKWNVYFKIIAQNILFGIGSIKNMNIGYVDSEFISILLQYGIVGFISYLVMLVTPILSYIENKINKHILLYYIPIFIIIVILNISAGSLLSYDTGVSIYIAIGVILSNENNFKTENEFLSKGIVKK